MTHRADCATDAPRPIDSRTDRPFEPPVRRGLLPLLVILSGTFVTFLDFFIVNVGLPSIQADLGASPASLSLVVAGYSLTFAVGMITGGRLGDRYGRRRVFTVGLALFTVASAACGLAPTMGVLNGSRLLQGAAGALLTPQVLAIIGGTFHGAQRERAFAAYGFTMGIAGVLGQVIGGALISADLSGLGWRLIFLINVPVGLAVLCCVSRVVPESFGGTGRLDLPGAGLLTVALVALVLPLVEGRAQGWPTWTWLSFLEAVVVFGVFVLHQHRRRRRGRATLVTLELFEHRSFVAGSIVTVVFWAVPPSLFFALAIHLQDGRGLSALVSGTVFAAVGAGYFAAMLVSRWWAARLGPRLLTLGAFTVAVGCGLLADSARAPMPLLVPGLVVAGAGIGLVLVPLVATVLARVTPEQAGSGAGMLATTQQIGGALGVASTSTLLFAQPSVVDGFVWCMIALAGLALASMAVTLLLDPHTRSVHRTGQAT